MASTRVVICPYCGETQPAADQCRACRGLFEPLSRQATHNEMGPWYVRDSNRPFQPGCSYETLLKLIDRKLVTRYTIVRGPTTRQFWTIARRVPGIAHLFGACHHCDASVDPEDHGCHACGAPFGAYLDRNYLGLPEVRPLPWEPDGDDAPLRDSEKGSWGWINEPTGLSSFATNAELFGTPGIDPDGDHAAAGGAHGGDDDHGRAAHAASRVGAGESALSQMPSGESPRRNTDRGGTAVAQDPAPTELAAEDTRRLRSAEARVRTLQQQSARQMRVTRLLTILAIALSLSVIVLTVVLARTGGFGGGAPMMNDTAPPQTAGEHASDPADATGAADDADEPDTPESADEPTAGAPGTPAATGPGDPIDGEKEQVAAALDDDLDLAARNINRASQGELSHAARVDLINTALDVLTAALDHAADAEMRRQIESLIERAEAEQARLEVEALLGDPQ